MRRIIVAVSVLALVIGMCALVFAEDKASRADIEKALAQVKQEKRYIELQAQERQLQGMLDQMNKGPEGPQTKKK